MFLPTRKSLSLFTAWFWLTSLLHPDVCWLTHSYSNAILKKSCYFLFDLQPYFIWLLVKIYLFDETQMSFEAVLCYRDLYNWSMQWIWKSPAILLISPLCMSEPSLFVFRLAHVQTLRFVCDFVSWLNSF
jgi:hypothetical protein